MSLAPTLQWTAQMLILRVLHANHFCRWRDNRSASPRTKGIIQKYMGMTRKYIHPAPPYEVLSNPSNWGGVGISYFRSEACDVGNINNRSIVTVVEYVGMKILIPGDNEECSWEELLSRPDFYSAIEKTNMLIASHHGRRSGFYGRLFHYFRPAITIVSDGRERRY